MQLFKDANYPFVKFKNAFFVFSAACVLLSAGSIVARGGLKYGIDFKGGSLIQIQFKGAPDVAKMRSLFAAHPELGEVEIKEFGEKKDNEVLIGVQKNEGSGSSVDEVRQILQSTFPDEFSIRRQEEVGPKIGDELKWKALLSIFLSSIAIILYLAIRFQWIWGVGAVIALLHDVFITIGAFSLLDIEISMPAVAAFLTILGYSINDTIVVYDRIRENLIMDKKSTVPEIFNHSINQTLSRTIITSLLTLFSVIALYVIGVSTIKDFAFAMTIGIVYGTYSSVGVAAGLVLSLSSPEKLRLQKRV